MNDTAYFSRWEYQNIALAAVAQCASLVDSLAQHGKASETGLIACVNPLFVVNPDRLGDIYPNAVGLNPGLKILQDMFSNDKARENINLVRYTLSMLQLRNQLVKNQPMQEHIRKELEPIKPLEFVAYSDDDGPTSYEMQQAVNLTFEQLANLYQDTISQLSNRVQVHGSSDNLKNPIIANKIRAALLAGIRSSVLWYQLGGRRWRLVFYRKRVQETAGNIRRKLIALV